MASARSTTPTWSTCAVKMCNKDYRWTIAVKATTNSIESILLTQYESPVTGPMCLMRKRLPKQAIDMAAIIRMQTHSFKAQTIFW